MEVRLEQIQFGRGGRSILSIPSLTFPHASTTALFGPNGSGKTTLLRLIAGLERPSAGRVSSGTVAFAFQRPVFIHGTVRRNLALGLSLQKVPNDEIDQRLGEAAVEFGIQHLLDRSARALSAGEAQRVNLARALCLRAPITLLDEPLAGLDRVARGLLLEDLPHLLKTFATTTIIVTHDREEAFRLANRLVVLVDGEVRAEGISGEVYRRPPDRLTAELLGYMIIPMGESLVAVPPGGLSWDGAGPEIEIQIERLVDMGNHRDVIGLIGRCRVSVRVPDDASPMAGNNASIRVRKHVPLPAGPV